MTYRTLLSLGAAAALLMSACSAPAQDTDNPDDQAAIQAEAVPLINPACAGPLYRQFDFWLGEWSVTAPNGQVAGINNISMEEGGCLIIERWRGAGGDTGQSYNYVDRDTGQWRQVWVSNSFTIDYSGGLNDDGAMALEGRIAYAGAPQNNGPFRGKWTLREDGTVEQAFHQFNPKTEEWTPWFTGIYTKVESGE